MKAVILAGGLGMRMRPYTKTTPKPMLLLGKKPILEHTIMWARKAGIRDIVLCLSYKHKQIVDYFGDGSKLRVRIEYAITYRPMSTAGQLRSASDLVDSTFVCAYGDSLFGHSLSAMVRHHARTESAVTIATSRHKTVSRYGVIRTAQGGDVLSWDEKPEHVSLINTGCYVLEPEFMSLIPRNKTFGMDTAVNRAIAQGLRVTAYITRGTFVDVGDISTYEEARKRFAAPRARGVA